jgi:hypothetical protein
MEIDVEDSSSTWKCLSPYERIIYVCRIGFKKYMLECGPVKLNVLDLCTLLPPHFCIESKAINSAVQENFVPGWLVDKVLFLKVQIAR